jgi:hypothetical protein
MKRIHIKKVGIIVFYLLFLTLPRLSQAQEKEIELLYFNHGDSVSFRWGTANGELFRQGVQKGYLVQRRLKGEQEWNTITGILRPASDEQFALLESIQPDAAVVRELIYRNSRKQTNRQSTDTIQPGTLYPLDGKEAFEENFLFGMAMFVGDISIDIAKATALYYVDKPADKTAVYEYRVVFADLQGAEKAREVTVDMQQESVLPTPDVFEAEFAPATVLFTWQTEKFEGYYSAYRIERSLDGTNFEPVRERPIVHGYTEEKFKYLATYQDTLVDRETMHYYRLSGYSPFGMYGPVSKVVQGRGEPKFDDVVVRIDTVTYDKKNRAEIFWTMNKAFEKRIKGFAVQKISNFEEEFRPVHEDLLSPKKRSFRDTNPGRSNYYRVVAYGTREGQTAVSNIYFKTRIDSIPPAAPKGLKGTVDSTGIVRLEWQPNTEEDLLGYRLFVSNSGRPEDFLNAIDTFYRHTSYVDTLSLQTLTNDIYYKVLALDNNFNPSEFSETVKLVKPDTIPPVPALFVKIHQPKEKIELIWDNSSSEDLARVELYRQIDDTGSVHLLKEWEMKKIASTYTDSYSFSGETVRYFIKSYDRSGNVSQTTGFPFQAKGERPGCVGNLSWEISRTDQKHILLRWENIGKCNITRFVVYRKENDGRMLAIASVTPNNYFFKDEDVTIGSKYVYVLRTISENPTNAIYSQEISF